MGTIQNFELNGDEVLTAFARTDGANLTEWMNRYPAQARELARFASERWTGEDKTPAQPQAVARIREIGLASLQARRTAEAATFATGGALTNLVAAATAKGLDADAVAAKLQVPYALFFKLHRRLIAAESVPASFVRSLADTIGRTVDEVSAYLRQPPTLAAGASYRADDTPTVGAQEDFATALRSDPEATDEQISCWLGEEN